jgi:hypothetical protein
MQVNEFSVRHGKNEEIMQLSSASIGVITKLGDNGHCQQLHMSALSPPSPLQAEAYGLLLATEIADALHIQEPQYYTDCSVLASTATATSIFKCPHLFLAAG